MMKKSDIGSGVFKLVSDEILTLDEVLNDVGAPNSTDLGINQSDLVGANANNYVAFNLENVKYGRLYEGKATGPDGESGALFLGSVDIGYEYTGIPGGQSPHTKLILPDYVLDPPVKLGGIVVSLKGAIDVTGAGSGFQWTTTHAFDRDGPLSEDLLESKLVHVPHPQGAWDGVLIPYETTAILIPDSNGHISGNQGTSGEASAEVFQYLIRPGFSINPESGWIVFP
jgi:hypothetical protein